MATAEHSVLPDLLAPVPHRIDPDDPILGLMPKFPFPTTASSRYFIGEDGRLKCGVEVRDASGKAHWSHQYDQLDEGDPA